MSATFQDIVIMVGALNVAGFKDDDIAKALVNPDVFGDLDITTLATALVDQNAFGGMHNDRLKAILTATGKYDVAEIDRVVANPGFARPRHIGAMPTPYPMTPITARTSLEWAAALFGIAGWQTSNRLDPAAGAIESQAEGPAQSVVARGPKGAVDAVYYVAVGGEGASQVVVNIYPNSTRRTKPAFTAWNGGIFGDGPCQAIEDIYWWRCDINWAAAPTASGVFYAKTDLAPGAGKPFYLTVFKGL